MNLAVHPVPSRDRLAYLRELRPRLDPSGDPADAMTERNVEAPGSVSSRLAAELALAPKSTHVLIGGVGSGKTPPLIVGKSYALLPIAALLVATPACHETTRPVLAVSARPVPAGGIHFSGKIPADRPHSSGREDLDGNGAEDCWDARWEGGSGAGGIILEIRAPCSAPPQIVDTTSTARSFLAQVALPREIARHQRLVEGVIELLFGYSHLRRRESIDGSFRWLIEHRLAAAGPAVAPFASTGRYTPIWSPGAPVTPPSQVLILEGPAGSRALLAYFAHNHGELASAASCGSLSVFSTRHGVAVHDRDRAASSWIYISTDATKLRRPSIGSVACAGELVAIEHGQDDQVEIFLVSPRTGRYGRLPVKGPYSIDASGLTVDGATSSLETLAEALRRSSSP